MNQAIRKRIEDINNGIVPEGYKQTPFGIFPCDWENKNLSWYVNIIDGDRGKEYPKETDFSDSGYCLFLNAGNVTANGFCFKDSQFITEEKCNKLKKGKLDIDDIVITTRGTVGNFALFTQKIPYCHIRINSGMAIIKSKRYLDLNYLFCSLKSYIIKNQIKKICFGSAQPQLTIPSISGMQVAFAQDKTEQGKIAEILMKWDEMVELQEQYIQKLELRKKAIMKKLLTPKDGWGNYKLLELVVSMSSGGTPSTKRQEYYNGDIVWVSIDDMSRAGKHIADSARKLTDLGLKNSSAKLFPEQTILYAMYASIGKTVISTVPCATSQAILGIIANQEKLDNQYLYYYLLNMQDKIVLQGQKGTQANLNKEMVEKFDISLPKDLDEQKNISKILMIVDEEISLQKEKLEKIKIQRKAMQQYLLTGIVRVV